ncbi:MAG: DUF2142 domain-containing protein [Verrucomicrobiia bacterium]
MNAADSNPPVSFSESRERNIVWLLCLLAAVHVFVFSAAFPFFNNVDEQIHFDLAVKYSQGHLPRSLEPVSAEAVPYAVLYGSPEFVGIPANFADGRFPPPPWRQPVDGVRRTLAARTQAWDKVLNYEASQPPLYYSLAGAWWRMGKMLGFHDGPLLYWLRFLDIFLVGALVWLGYTAAQLIFPERQFLRLGVPALLAFMPQTAFYSIQNDLLSPLCFGSAFICLVKWLRTEVPDVRLGIATGLALAATFLTKISNLPLLAVSGVVLLLKIRNLAEAGKWRASSPALTALALCAGLPMMAWLAWCKHAFGDFSGTAAKIQFLGWTQKPFGEWWHHPIFTPHGLWTFLSELLASFWQGEFLWHRQPLASPVVDLIYAILSIGLVGAAVIALVGRSGTAAQRQALWFGLGCFLAAVVFLGFLSILYDFHDCFYPSTAHPYFKSGRLMLGALIPFLLLLVFGLDRALGRRGKPAKFLALAGMILFMLVSEIAIDWAIFPDAYNWFHL